MIFGTITGTSAVINWTSGTGGNGYLVLVHQGSATIGTPVDGTTYSSPSTVYGGGTAIGSDYVAYICSCNSFTLTGLTATTSYYVSVFDLNGNGYNGSENYLTTSPATGN